ncbi:MAG TPA: Hsp20/alpha crystallin family protein [Nitrososphaera sp.]|jgi:HSP20 family molecular chaperone IbpA|nr:Hsp20/alpha crystallin family protein [Nitrososphaera sp.]
MFVLFARAQGGIGFIFLTVGSGLLIYWIREIRIMMRPIDEKMATLHDSPDQKDWVYDLINNNGEMVFVAEVPGPEDQINVRLTNGMLQIKGGQNFVRNVPVELTEEMSISDYKYRNGVLTVKIQKM